MELKIKEYQLPEVIDFNYQELKQELEEKITVYTNLVYSDDQIKLAKADRANLNKLKKALNDERIRREREYLEPFNTFKNQIKELISIIDKPVVLIDKQIKSYEQQQIEEKRVKLEQVFNGLESPDWLTFEQIFSNRWLQNSVSIKAAKDSMNMTLERVAKDLDTIEKLPEFAFEALQVYKTTLDINNAISEAQRMSQIQKQKREHEAELAKQAEKEKSDQATMPLPEADDICIYADMPATPKITDQPPKMDEARMWVAFEAYLTTSDATALKAFFESRNIEFRPVAG
jgi:hypothetical protein